MISDVVEHDDVIKTVRFDSLKPGLHLVVLGAIHGNETCGSIAIERIISEFEQGQKRLIRGTVTFVPVCNPRAYRLGVRFCERNLNRGLFVKAKQSAYEDQIDPILCRILDQADVLIDLHSYGSTGGPFCFLGTSSQAEIDLCRRLGIHDFVYGWAKAFGRVQTDSRESMGTVEYARSKGAIATTIECGNHADEQAPDVAYSVLNAGLAHLGLISDNNSVNLEENQRFVQMQAVYFKEEEGVLERPWRHYDAVKSGQVLARYHSGRTVVAPLDGFVVLPKLAATLGNEWFYFGVPTACPKVDSSPEIV